MICFCFCSSETIEEDNERREEGVIVLHSDRHIGMREDEIFTLVTLQCDTSTQKVQHIAGKAVHKELQVLHLIFGAFGCADREHVFLHVEKMTTSRRDLLLPILQMDGPLIRLSQIFVLLFDLLGHLVEAPQTLVQLLPAVLILAGFLDRLVHPVGQQAVCLTRQVRQAAFGKVFRVCDRIF